MSHVYEEAEKLVQEQVEKSIEWGLVAAKYRLGDLANQGCGPVPMDWDDDDFRQDIRTQVIEKQVLSKALQYSVRRDDQGFVASYDRSKLRSFVST